MTDTDLRVFDSEWATSILVGFYAAILTAVVTLVTFVLALTAIPISGPNCLSDCIEYPYLDTVAQFSKKSFPADLREYFVSRGSLTGGELFPPWCSVRSGQTLNRRADWLGLKSELNKRLQLYLF